MKTRKFFLVMIAHNKKGIIFLLSSQVGGCKCGTKMTEIIDRIILANEIAMKDQLERQATHQLGKANDYKLFDWEGNILPKALLLEEIPKPGILIAVRPGPDTNEELMSFIPTVARSQLEESDGIKEYLQDMDAAFEPAESCRYDVFISYSSQDSKVAAEIEISLHEQELDCFLAEKSIQSGRLWREDIRDALRSSRLAVLLLTPHSVNSKWVMCEAGALWALKKTLVPAYMFIDIKEMPELISEYQCKRIESIEDRKQFVKDVYRMCRG